MKHQINAINIFGAVISASLLVFSHFSPVQNAASKVLRLVTSKNSRNIRLSRESLDSKNTMKIQMPPASFTTTRIQTPSFNKCEKSSGLTTVIETQKLEPESSGLTTVIETQKLEPESIQLAGKCKQLASKSNVCPKNLDYFTKKPRPKQTPEECITCKNLITCVCLTSN